MILVSTTTTTQRFAIDPAHTNAQFSVRHLMISKVHGRFATIAGTIEVPEGATVPTSVDVTIEVDSIDTRELQRDAHLKSPDFFDAANFPQITFRSTRFEGDGESFKTIGDLTIHGVTREVTLDTTFEGRGADPWGNNRIGYEAHTKISRKDFGLNWNVALEAGGVTVGDEVKIELNVEAIAQ
ncbi:MAG: YceI family protein [Candidatus Eremiobacteraeota bacterium]|nr:YceI family protein [Candidatus Eremiobacteraeota bacterium]